MTSHNFKKTLRVKKKLTVYRCDNCDSEVLFKADKSESYVNQQITIMFPKFGCIRKI